MSFDFAPIRLKPEWRNFCVYLGRHLPEDAMTVEHVIHRAVGGSGATAIRCCRVVNSRLGHEIDAKIADDPMIIFGRRDADARGHSGSPPKVNLKRAAAWKRGEPWGKAPPRYNIEVPGGGQPALVYDTRSGQHLPGNAFADTGFVIHNLNIDSNARAKFVAKTLLGMGWKLFGERFLTAGETDSLRAMIGTCAWPTSEQSRLYYLDPFVVEQESPAKEPFQVLQDRMARKDRATILMRHTEFGLEWSVSCFGYHVGSLIYPVRHSLLPDCVAPNGGILVTVEKHRLAFDAVEPFPAPWGP